MTVTTDANRAPRVSERVALALVAGPLVGLRAVGALAPPVPWSPARRGKTAWLTGLLVFAGWLFQLHRLGFGWATD